MSSYLGREDAPFSSAIWEQIDSAVISAARETLVGRKFLTLHGPLGAGASFTVVDQLGYEEVDEEGFSVMRGRTLHQVPQLHEEFWLYWRQLEAAGQAGITPDVSAARMAAQTLALREDRMIFYGIKSLGLEGLANAKGVNTVKRSGSWSEGENAYTDVAQAMALLLRKGRIGRLRLIVSPDVLVQLERLQPGTGVLESKRIEKLLGNRILMTVSLEPGTAILVSAQPQYVDLVVGQDIVTAYTEAVDLNHHLRVMETAAVRVKSPDAIVQFK